LVAVGLLQPDPDSYLAFLIPPERRAEGIDAQSPVFTEPKGNTQIALSSFRACSCRAFNV